MAIKIYEFENFLPALRNQTQENLKAYQEELLSWLKDNAAEFFDSITLSNDIITMAKGDAYLALRVDFGSSTQYTCTRLKNGLLTQMVTNSDRFFFDRAVKTDTGVYLCQYYASNSHYADIIITRTKSGHTCFVWARRTNAMDTGGNNLRNAVSCVDLDSSTKTYYFGGDTSSSTASVTWIVNQVVFNADASVLSPLLFSGGETTDNAFVMPFSQAASLEHKKVSIDGVEYFTNGYFALRG